MKEIKFRGRRADNGEWVYGDLEYNRAKGIARIHSYDDEGNYIGQDVVDASTIGQYTGLKDKEGYEIYEGDIVEYYDDIEDELLKGFIQYEVDVCSFCIIPINPAEKFGWTAYWSVKVIGNKFDNPELMERKEE